MFGKKRRCTRILVEGSLLVCNKGLYLLNAPAASAMANAGCEGCRCSQQQHAESSASCEDSDGVLQIMFCNLCALSPVNRPWRRASPFHKSSSAPPLFIPSHHLPTSSSRSRTHRHAATRRGRSSTNSQRCSSNSHECHNLVPARHQHNSGAPLDRVVHWRTLRQLPRFADGVHLFLVWATTGRSHHDGETTS